MLLAALIQGKKFESDDFGVPLAVLLFDRPIRRLSVFSAGRSVFVLGVHVPYRCVRVPYRVRAVYR